MNDILRKQFLMHVGQTSPSPMMIEVARAEGTFFYTPEGKRYWPEYRSTTSVTATARS